MMLSKLEIIAYSDETFQTEEGRITVPVNPAKYNRTIKVKYNEDQEQGTQGNSQPFEGVPPEEIQLEFVIDNTGAIPDSSDVTDKVKEFSEILYKVQDKIHRPSYLQLLWGTLSFHCSLKELKIDYTLFKPDGKPIRALLNATFMEVIEANRRSAEQGYNSPDLTHIRYLREGDTLPLMAHRIYGNASLYIQVAKFNNLQSFRNIPPNTKIIFPPIDKTLS
jgi:hypothetical protein